MCQLVMLLASLGVGYHELDPRVLVDLQEGPGDNNSAQQGLISFLIII